jgi:hypothetical protein
MNAPTVTPEIQKEVARSLLERLGEKTALVRFFRYNASAKHGVPIDSPATTMPWTNTQDTTTKDTTTTAVQQPIQQPVQQPIQQPVQTATVTPQTLPSSISVNLTQPPQIQQQAPVALASTSDFAKGVLITLAALCGIGGAAYAGYAMANKAPQQAEKQVAPEKPLFFESPYQFLEDRGEHLP